MKVFLTLFFFASSFSQWALGHASEASDGTITYSLVSSQLVVANSQKEIVTNDDDGSITVLNPRVRIGLRGESYTITRGSDKGFCALLEKECRHASPGRDDRKKAYMRTRMSLTHSGGLNGFLESNRFVSAITCE